MLLVEFIEDNRNDLVLGNDFGPNYFDIRNRRLQVQGFPEKKIITILILSPFELAQHIFCLSGHH